MSGVKVVRSRISELDIGVSIENVSPVFIPLPERFPCIVMQSMSLERKQVVSKPQTSLWIEDVQVTVISKRYDSLESIFRGIITGLDYAGGNVAGVDVDSIVFQGGGADGFDDDTETFARSCDFSVKYRS